MILSIEKNVLDRCEPERKLSPQRSDFPAHDASISKHYQNCLDQCRGAKEACGLFIIPANKRSHKEGNFAASFDYPVSLF